MTNSPTNSIPNTTSRVNHFTGLARRRRKFSLLPANGDGSTLTLDFTTDQLDPRLTFTRASDATFINSSGLVQWADANHVQNSTMLNNTGTRWTQATSGGTVTINGDGTVRFNGTGGRATWLQSVGSLASGLPMTFSFRVTSFTNTSLRTTDLFNAGTGFTGQSYFYTDTTGTTHTLTAFESLPKSGTNGVGTYSVTATTNATSANIIFGSDCNGVGSRSGDVTITEPQLQYGTVVPRRVYVPNSSIIAAKWDSARFDYDPTTLAPKGLLIEGSSGNLLQQSVDWTVSPWSKPATITWDGSTFATAPDGTTSAKQITVTGGSSASIAQAVTTGTNRTISLWLRAGSLTSFSVGAFDSAGTTWGNNADSTCRIISGPGNAPVQQVGGLWSITGLSTTQWTRVEIFRSTTYTNLLAYPGSSSGTINGTAYVWGMQMEAGNGASSLIPTGASTATRIQDQMQMTNLASLGFNTNAGTMTINGTYNKDANAFPRSIRFMGSSVQSMAMITAGKTLYGNTPNTSGGSYFEASRTLASAGAFKFGWTLTTAVNPAIASATVSLNGSSTLITPLGQGTIVNPVTLDFLYGAGAPTDYPSMNVASMKYWPYAMTSTQLNAMTA
jgi:hypothetical protein